MDDSIMDIENFDVFHISKFKFSKFWSLPDRVTTNVMQRQRPCYVNHIQNNQACRFNTKESKNDIKT